MSRHWNGQVRDGGSGTGRHGIASDAAARLRTEGQTPESVEKFLRQAAEAVPAPRGSENARQGAAS